MLAEIQGPLPESELPAGGQVVEAIIAQAVLLCHISVSGICPSLLCRSVLAFALPCAAGASWYLPFLASQERSGIYASFAPQSDPLVFERGTFCYNE
ncbi:hypothetical protein GCWU000342_01411 [Shuttleworthella satelles DSM 14600]|uniref:Uncharacterized protein n=1 Tax=Shuttleworthella satelles DSM 14600 TaxID=626523 RepID=C4GBV8_9FIRM|nr:hypothetical protein GCWU000342_01411 [Shuttleworthia satelles DSM 14600]